MEQKQNKNSKRLAIKTLIKQSALIEDTSNY